MRIPHSILRVTLLLALLSLLPAGHSSAADVDTSGFGKIAIPSPQKPANAEQCVEPVAVMRRDHMKFLMHQRDETVINGERETSYSLVGCMNCHNPAQATGEVVRYEDPQHFCAECHAYTSVKIDCFECHADRGLEQQQQSRLDSAVTAWEKSGAGLDAGTLTRKLEGDQ